MFNKHRDIVVGKGCQRLEKNEWRFLDGPCWVIFFLDIKGDANSTKQ